MADRKQRNELVFLEDIHDSMERISKYVEDTTEDDFDENTEKQDAVIRRIEIIGEASKNTSVATRQMHPEVRWREMAGMRDMVAHNYFGVSMGLVWRVATQDIPELKVEIELINKNYKPPSESN